MTVFGVSTVDAAAADVDAAAAEAWTATRIVSEFFSGR